jgi:sialate O-acetylesterase
LVWSKKNDSPVAARYAWADDPRCNLYNSALLPASPFRTDDWLGIKEEYGSNYNKEIKK